MGVSRNMVSNLNTLIGTYKTHYQMESEKFPEPEKGVGCPLPEDFMIRGLVWTSDYFPETWFSNAMVDDEERSLELASMAADRRERILWLAFQLSKVDTSLFYNIMMYILTI